MTRLTILTVLSLALANANGKTVGKAAEETNNTSAPFMPIITLEEPVFFKLTEYTDKICKNQPTCHLVKNAPESHQQMGVRNCMCDEDCRKYGDCCLDSPFYNETEQKANFQAFYCSSKDLIYMVADCPNDYPNNTIRQLCRYAADETDNNDATIITPVTDLTQNQTYGNIYCAQCNGILNSQVWTVVLKCKPPQNVNNQTTNNGSSVDNKINPSASPSSSDKVHFKPLDYNSKPMPFFNNVTSTTTTSHPDTVIFKPNRPKYQELVSVYQPDADDEAAKYAKFDPTKKSFQSFYKGQNYTCTYQKTAPPNVLPVLRYCIPSVSTCPASYTDSAVSDRCHSYTAVVFIAENPYQYRNQHCAQCNGNMQRDLPGCVEQSNRVGGSILFSGGNRGTGSNICTSGNNSVRNKFCP